MLQKIVLRLLNIFYPLVKKWLPFQVFAYLAVGAANTVLNIALFTGIYTMLVRTQHGSLVGSLAAFWAVEIATVVSFLITLYTGFWLSKNIAFTDAGNEKKEKVQQLGRYFLVSLQGQFSDYLITKGLIVLAGVNPVVAYFIATAIMLTINFFLQKHFTFQSKKRVAIP